MSGPILISHGCRLNIAESAKIAALLAGERDLVVVNSCAVTAEAVKTARQAIRRAKRDRPDARIVVTGCAAEIEPESFTAMEEVSGVVPNTAKFELSGYLPSSRRRPGPQEAWRNPPAAPASAGATHARTFLPVQNGCDHRCTFCIIPFGRGPSRSLPAGGVIDEIKAAVDAGAREVVLTGVDLTAYGADLPGRPSLGALVTRILRYVPDLPRLRLSSLDPCEVDAPLFELIAQEPRLMPHLHLSLQAGNDLILKRMKRRHSRQQAVDLVAQLRARRPEIAIGADLIAGFPTEDEAMFADTLALIDDCSIAFAHIFPYSPRAGTPAARMPQVARPTVKARAAQLRTVAAARKAAWLQEQIGSVTQILVELDGVSGHAENFMRVALPPAIPNSLVTARIVAVDGDTAIGIPA
ncbi:tRNA (N(6)-L-threonylcarbamoyladenosine(37)-C(2))-methylthiotransferase MtaB [Sphingomonas sp. ASY06-1R]|uniref:tRNA (N(6)-L-threonylcarbamoyladenosine(37)-C(2))- methylthiotransferase MtaB n=1 Tax=Sphingomonas sp. ASY06-1R TaxID=3445771 RepID=UPI003FA29766